MKNLLKVFAVAVAVVLAACSKDSVEAPAVTADEAQVTFTTTIPGATEGRAIADGSTVDKLYYAVYEHGATKALIAKTEPISGKTATVNVTLVSGLTYDIVFWAQKEGAPYTFNTTNNCIEIDWSDLKGNNEDRDAFIFVRKALEVNGSIQETITLKRPFAQLNIGISDFEAAKAAGFELAETKVSVDSYNQINFFGGEAYSKADGTGDYGMPAGTETPVTFACAAPLADPATITIKGTAYKYVAMDYILPAIPTDAYDVDITFCTANEAKQYSVPTFAGVTFERNHRTNIMGSLLTDPAKFVVEIDEEFDDPDYDLAEQKSIQVSTAADFAAALATDAKFIVMAPGIYDGDYNLRNSAKTISSLDPANKAVITGKFVANSDVVFENIDFKPSEKSMKVLSTSTYGSYVNKGYTSIVTINRVKATFENCAFTELNDSYAASAINYFQEATGKVLEVNNCSFEGVAKAIYTKVLCKVTNSTFNLGDGAVPLYVWPRATGEGMLEVTNNDNLAAAKAYAAVGCLSQTAPFANVEFNVQNNSNMSGYAATNSARFATDGSVTFAAGSETFEITAEGKMQSSAAPVTSIRVNSAAQLKEALASTTLETIYLAPGTYDEVYYHNNGTKKIASGNPENKAVISGKFVAQSDVVFENVDFTPSAKSLTDLSTSTYGSKVNGSYHSIVTISYAVASFEGCSFSGLNTTYQASAINYFTESSGKVLKVNNCSFEGIAKAIYSKVLFEVTNSHFDLEDGVAIYVWPRATGEGKAVFTGNENAHANSMIAIGCLTQSGNYANMTFNVQGNTGTIRPYAAVNSARFDAATITFADGSETFAISAEGKML